MQERKELFQQLMKLLDIGTKPCSLVNGDLRDGNGQQITLVDPFTAQPLASYADAGKELTNEACQAAAEAQRRWQYEFSHHARGLLLMDISRSVLEQAELLAKLEALVAGKPIRDCRVEVAKVAEMFSYYSGWSDKLHGEVIPVPSGHLNYTVREPLGVVFQITPWNAPIFTAGWQIAPAIATGNAVVIKPSELTPITTVALAVIAEKAGLPKGLINVISGLGPSSGQAAIAHEHTRKIIFVGSPQTGREVAISASKALKPVVLELGGKSANIVFSDASLKDACKGAQAAIFSAAGQSCVAGSRLLVQRSIFEEFQSMVTEGMVKLALGDPLLDSTEVGPVCSATQFSRINAAIEESKKDGARVMSAHAPGGDGFFIPPTVLGSLSNTSSAAQEEIFGPVVTAIPFEDEDEVIELANQSQFGLAGAVWTSDIGRGHRVASAVRAGTFWINSYKAIHVSSPFGGSLSSGFGRSSGTDALMEYTAAKSIWIDTDRQSKIAFGYAPE